MTEHHHPTRRGFLQSSAAAALSLTAMPKLFAAEDKKADDFGGFGTQAQDLHVFRHFDLEPALKKIQELGLRYGEFYPKHIPLNSTPEQLQAILKLCKEYDVKPVAFGVQRFTKKHDDNKKVFDFGKAIGIKTFSADPDPDSFDSLDKLCEEYKIAIGIHPHGPQGKDKLHRWYSAEIIMNAVKDHHKLIGSCLDTGHLIRSAQYGQEARSSSGNPRDGAQLRRSSQGPRQREEDRRRLQQLRLDLREACSRRAARQVKFAYALSIEYEANEANPSEDVRQCVQVFKDSVGQK